MFRVFVVLLYHISTTRTVHAYKDWYFGVEKVPDYRMMALKPVASITDSILYTCSAAVSNATIDIQFLVNFRNLSIFCAPPADYCRILPLVERRVSRVRSNLSIYEARLEFWSTKPKTGTVSCVFNTEDREESLAQLYGFFRIFPQLPLESEDKRFRDTLCNVQQGCRWEETHCSALNHQQCFPCQQGMGFDKFYHLCYDPRQLNQSCVFSHQCIRSDPRSLCVERLCTCRARHVIRQEKCMPTVELGFLCGPGTVCTEGLVCRENACQCKDNFIAKGGVCVSATKVEVKDILIIASSTMIVFTAFTSMLCLLLRDKYGEEDESGRSDRSRMSTAPL